MPVSCCDGHPIRYDCGPQRLPPLGQAGKSDARPVMTGSDADLGFIPRHHSLRAARGHGLRSGKENGRLDGASK
jgi:hypothetical protein